MSASIEHLVGITGHQALSPETRILVSEAVRDVLSDIDDLVIVTSLAAGADQICAEVALEFGGQLIAVLPSQDYTSSFSAGDDLDNFNRLLMRAREIRIMPFEKPSELAYWSAGQEIVNRTNWLLAIWDGKPAGGLGGTADVVGYARSKGKPVTIIWPQGAQR
jgi:hypothetical protein